MKVTEAHLAEAVEREIISAEMLTAIGLSIIYLGVVWQRNEDSMTRSLHALLPQQLQELLQARLRT